MEPVDPKKEFTPVTGKNREKVRSDLPSSSEKEGNGKNPEKQLEKIEDKVELSGEYSSRLPIGDPEVKISPLEMRKYVQMLQNNDFEEEITELQKELPRGEEHGLDMLENDLRG